MVVIVVFVVVVLDVVFVVVVLDIDVVVSGALYVDLRLLVIEVEFGWVGWWWWVVCRPIFVSNPTQLSKGEVVLRLSWGCDNKRTSKQWGCDLIVISLVSAIFYKSVTDAKKH